MSDERLRGLERQFQGGDTSIESTLLAARLRTGELDPAILRFTSHIGYGPAREVTTEPAERPCQCVRGPTRGTNDCIRCQNTRVGTAPKGLIATVRDYPLDGLILARWATDCVERAVVALPENHTDRAPFIGMIELVRRWIQFFPLQIPRLVGLGIRAVDLLVEDDHHTQRAVQELTIGASDYSRGREEYYWRRGFAETVSRAYKALGYRRSERDWQIDKLAYYLLHHKEPTQCER